MSTLLVAIPVWPGDAEQVLANLNAQRLRDGKTEHGALLVYDQRMIGNPLIHSIAEKAKETFSHLDWLQYEAVAPNSPWPVPQNRCWQSAVRFCEEWHANHKGWFWWESDALPLAAKWLDILADAYVAGRRPFMGHIVPGRGHMNGVAVYPFGISAYAIKAFFVKRSPFDVTLSKEVGLRNITEANHLIAHTLKVNGGDIPFLMSQRERSDIPLSVVVAHGYRSVIDSSVVVDYSLTTVITNHGRAEKLWRAFQSCMAAKLNNIVVVSTLPSAVREVQERMVRVLPSVRILNLDKDPGCNAAWLAGIRAAPTKWVHLLHDDDIVLPDFLNIVAPVLETDVRFVLMNAQYHLDTAIHKGDPIWDRADGAYEASELTDRLLKSVRSISPVSGIFEKDHLESVLCEFQDQCVGRADFQISPTMQVGNDLLIWLRATELKGKFRWIEQPLVSYGNHPESTTVLDQTSKKNRLPIIYRALKDYWKGKTNGHIPVAQNCATFCYVPDLRESRGFLDHLNSWKRRFPLHLIAHEPMDQAIIAPPPPQFREHHGCLPSDQYAGLAFLRVLRAAADLKLSHFILIETDCRFAADYWDERMWQEFKAWPTQALFGGSPVCWHPWSQGYQKSCAIIDYAYRYQQASGVMMAFEGAYSSPWGLAVYPNGALGIYNVTECLEYFAELLPVIDASAQRQANALAAIHTFDIHIGRCFVRKHGVEGALSKLAYLPSVYSGCKNHHVPLEDRLEMWRSGKKIAVHHIKTSEAPW